MNDEKTWGMYHVFFNYDTKYFIPLLRVEEDEFGFIQTYWKGYCINSGKENASDPNPSHHIYDVEINPNLNCPPLIRKSYVNIGRLEMVAERDLDDFRRILDRGSQKRIKESAQNCHLLSENQRDLICALPTRRY